VAPPGGFEPPTHGL